MIQKVTSPHSQLRERNPYAALRLAGVALATALAVA
jgi:hypothetical protein